ncbi:MAG: M28 family peptidase [Candidatus Korobacteraceae bacterium]
MTTPSSGAAIPNDYFGMPSNEEIFRFIETMWQFGDQDKFGWRMPGTRSDHQAAEFIEQQFRDAGLADVRREPVPVPVHFPESWKLTVHSQEVMEEVPCWFVRYAAFTPAEGITADLLDVGKGSEEEFRSKAGQVAGNIVLVEMFSHGVSVNYGEAPLWLYDPNNTLTGDKFSETYPVDNQDAVIDRARRYGAAAVVGILVSRPDDVCVEYHGRKRGNEVIPALTVSPSTGRRIKELLGSGHARATVVLAEDPGSPPPGGPSRFGKWGVTHNIYGVLPGATDEVLLLESHHDGGAVNEGSGPAVMIAMAKYLVNSGIKLKKTVLFFVIGSHFGLRPPLLDQARGIAAVRSRIACSMVVEMIGCRQYKVRDGRHVPTGLNSPVMWGVKNGNQQLVAIVREVVEKHRLERSYISDHLLGEGATLAKEGGMENIIEHIALNAPQFSLEDRPEVVDKEALRPSACAFVDILQRLDAEL